MKTIQEELGGTQEEEIDEMLVKTKKMGWKNQKHFEKKLSKMRRMNPQAPDFGFKEIIWIYFFELPWNVYSKDNFD
jgi:ATP-dependent Lon protease